MKPIFLDTEFSSLEDPRPISLGLVSFHAKEYYCELPPESYLPWASEWVKKNVICWLEGHRREIPAAGIPNTLVQWIETLQEPVRLVCDAPDYDMKIVSQFLKPWPKNLAPDALRFSAAEAGQRLESVIEQYHSTERPKHHALHDAHALRLGYLDALDRGLILQIQS